jgi:drug/metabolite transporter (DMT)-like permease
MKHEMNESNQLRGAAFGLTAAMLFGASAPIAKWLLSGVSPVLLAGLLYLGAAIGLWLHRAFASTGNEAPISRNDVGKVMGLVLAGGVLGPVFMLLGLRHVTALAGSLLLNLEAPFTMLLAVVVFREHLGRAALISILFILVGAAALKLQPGTLGASGLGITLLAAACGCWAVDNNLTQRLSLRDPFAIVRVKTTVAGLANTALGLLVLKSEWPSLIYVSGALVLGSLSYGASVVLDAYALRLVGAAREAAYFATAPFVGVLIAVILLGESMHWYDGLSIVAMALGVIFLVREHHSHMHQHEAVEHEHLHEHDEHHQHGHSSDTPHTHPHRHEPLVHSHPHLSDAHHRHRH